MINSIYYNFLGAAPNWYKNTIISFLIVNPIIYILFDSMSLPAGFILGWIILGQFIFTLAMAIKCYPLQPGGLIALESILMGLTNTGQIYYEVEANLKVILLLVFMVAGIYFMKDFLLYIFTKLLINIKKQKTFVFALCIRCSISICIFRCFNCNGCFDCCSSRFLSCLQKCCIKRRIFF